MSLELSREAAAVGLHVAVAVADDAVVEKTIGGRACGRDGCRDAGPGAGGS